jgi:hypothetical protein
MITLSGRPLLDTKADVDLFVDRAAQLAALDGAVEARLNVLLLGDRGMGKTSLLRRLAFELRAAGRPHLFVDGAVTGDVAELLELVRAGVDSPGGPDGRPFVSLWNGAPIEDTGRLLRTLDEIQRSLDGSARTVLLDGAPSGRAAHTLFGRLRDELWQLPLSWVVAADADLRAEYLRPPADAFFDVVVLLDPLSPVHAREALRTRLGARALSKDQVEEAVAASGGNPRRLLAAARDILAGTRTAGRSSRRLELDRKLATLGRPAAMLVAELESLGRASASDDQLLNRLGWTRGRASQVFGQLEEAGIVTSSPLRGERGGRPRKVYELSTPVAG